MTTTTKYSDIDNVIVTYIFPVASVGAGLTWSGLPLLLANETGDLSNIFVLFLASVIAGALFTLLGGSVADHLPRKPFVVFCFFVDLTLTLTLAVFGSATSLYLFYAVSFSSALIGAMNGSILGLWIKEILSATSENLSRGLAKRGMWNISAKAIGFSLGPIIYGIAGFKALYVDAMFSMVPLVGILFVRDVHKSGKIELNWLGRYSDLARREFWTRERSLVLTLFAITAAYTVPTTMVCYAVLLSRFGTEFSHASSFWMLASLSSIVSHLGLSQRVADRLGSGVRLLASQLLMGAAFIGLWASGTSWLFIAFFMLFTLSNPVMTNALEVEVYEKCEDAFRGRFNALCQLADDVVGAAVLFLCQKHIGTGVTDLFYLLALPLMALVLLLIHRNRGYLSGRMSDKPIQVGH